MPSKKSKSRPPARASRPWTDDPACSEAGLREIAARLAAELAAGERVLLEGPLGAGKTTFARALLEALGVVQPPEGSPTYAIAHEYASPRGRIVHVDLYRIRNESEIEDAGLLETFWDPLAVVIAEWVSLWPEFAEALARAGGPPLWRVTLAPVESAADRRHVRVDAPVRLGAAPARA